MQRLFPDPGPADPMQLIPEALAPAARPQHPYTVANFIASVDGQATVDGGSTALGNRGDRRIFRALRGCADAVLAGTGTIEAEHYGTLVRDPEVAALRIRMGLVAQPPLVTITRSGRVPPIPLLDDPAATLIVYSAADPDLGRPAATVHVERRTTDALTLGAVRADLAERHGVGLLLCEGGPSLFHRLVSDGVCDELFLTVAPLLAAGEGATITAGPALDPPRALRLRWALAEDDALYLRYALAPRGTADC